MNTQQLCHLLAPGHPALSEQGISGAAAAEERMLEGLPPALLQWLRVDLAADMTSLRVPHFLSLTHPAVR